MQGAATRWPDRTGRLQPRPQAPRAARRPNASLLVGADLRPLPDEGPECLHWLDVEGQDYPARVGHAKLHHLVTPRRNAPERRRPVWRVTDGEAVRPGRSELEHDPGLRQGLD